jgi:hypothetical protein
LFANGQLTTFIFVILLKRIATTIVIFVFFFVVVYFATCIVGGAINGAISSAGNPNPNDAYDAGRQAGVNFVRQNIRAILLSSFAISFATSLALSFSGILPWCKNHHSRRHYEIAIA